MITEHLAICYFVNELPKKRAVKETLSLALVRKTTLLCNIELKRRDLQT